MDFKILPDNLKKNQDVNQMETKKTQTIGKLLSAKLGEKRLAKLKKEQSDEVARQKEEERQLLSAVEEQKLSEAKQEQQGLKHLKQRKKAETRAKHKEEIRLNKLAHY